MAVRVSAKGQVVIPVEIRKKLGLKKGDQVGFVEYAGNVYIVKVPEDPIEAAYGMLKGGPSMTEGLLRDRQEDLEREERKFQEYLQRSRQRSEAAQTTEGGN